MPNPFQQSVITIGQTVGRRPSVQFGTYQSDRLFHTLILGQTGTGKSTLLLNMMQQDVDAGHGFVLLDPHGDLADAIIPDLSDNAIYWDVADPDCPYGYNPLTYVAEQYRPLVASGIIDAFKKQWSDAWGVRMEHLLRFALLALLTRPNSSMADIVPMFTDKAFRRIVMQSVTDVQVQAFWNDEYPKMNYKGAFDGVAPIANKLGAFLSNPVVRRALCDPDHPIRLRQIMDSGTPLVVNLSKGRLGTDVADVLGGLLLSLVSQAAFSRVTLKPFERRQFTIYADEFHNFTTESTASMLSELRMFKVGMVLAGQYTSQIERPVLDAIFGNVGTLLCFRLGAQDAPLISRQLGNIDPSSLIGLPNYRMFVRLMVNGAQTKVFSAKALLVHTYLNK